MTIGTHRQSSDLLNASSLGTSPGAMALPRSAGRIGALVSAVVALLYLLLYNPLWVPGGDSELYLAVARNLALHRGYLFNGQFVSISPPGWPFLLAGAMR